MEDILRRLTKKMSVKPGVTREEIAQVEGMLQKEFPPDYVSFLLFTDGGIGSIGEGNYVELWPLEELIPSNEANEVNKYAPGLLLFGSDGGGEAYGFNTNVHPYEVVKIPFIGLEWEDAIDLSHSFIGFLKDIESQKNE